MFRFLSSARILSLLVAPVAAAALALPAAAAERTNCGTNGINVNNFRLSAWKSGNFSGSACRKYNDSSGSWIWLTLKVNGGGYDAAIGRRGGSKRADSISQNKHIYASVRLNNIASNENYWIGPKTSISKTSNYQGLQGNHECYIIDKANRGPAAFASWLKVTYKGQSTHNGSNYKHYTRNFNGINQVFSIRQNYRNGGWTQVGAILKKWRNLGIVPNNYVFQWKYNVETSGRVYGGIGLSNVQVPFH